LFWGFLTFFEKANANALYANLNERKCFFVRIDRFDERRDRTRYSNGSTAVLVILSKNIFVIVGQWVAAVIVVEVSTLLEGVTADVEPCKQSGRSGIAVERR
jgi:hypothetical protein